MPDEKKPAAAKKPKKEEKPKKEVPAVEESTLVSVAKAIGHAAGELALKTGIAAVVSLYLARFLRLPESYWAAICSTRGCTCLTRRQSQMPPRSLFWLHGKTRATSWS